MKDRVKFWIGGAVFLMVFSAIAFYGGEGRRFEACVFCLIFLASAAAVRSGELGRLSGAHVGLFAPLLLLAGYSLLQFFSTLGPRLYFGSDLFLLPDSFDLMASIWSAVKFAGFVCFIGLCLAGLRRDFYLTIWSLIAAGNFFALFGIVRFFLQQSFPDVFPFFMLPRLMPGTGFGTFLNQNHFALLMLMVFGLNLSFVWLGNFEYKKRLFLLAMTLMSWTAAILTASRGGIISSLAVVGVLSFFASAKNKGQMPAFGKNLLIFALFSIVLLAGVILIGQERVLHRFGDIRTEIDETVVTQSFRRVDVWEAGFHIIRANLIYGVGFGGFRHAVSQYIEISGRNVPAQAHNDYLEFVASGGLIAVLLAAWFLFRFIAVLKKRFRTPGNRLRHSARVGAVSAMSGVAMHSFFDFGLQFAGNFLFFAALVAIAVMPPRGQIIVRRIPAVKKTGATILLLLLAGLSAAYLFQRLEPPAGGGSASGRLAAAFFFDAEHHAATADLYLAEGNRTAAAEALGQAVFYQPKDHTLWLKLAVLESAADHRAAENAFRNAVRLAPFYGEPRFAFGKFLIETGRGAEGMSELATVFHNDTRFADAALEIIRENTDLDVFKTHALLQPLTDREKARLALFLLKKKDYDALAELWCAGALMADLQNYLVSRLLENKRYHAAWRIFQSACGEAVVTSDPFIDGGFEAGELRRGQGFGWRVGEQIKPENLFFDEERFSMGKQSLRFTLEGESEMLISQIVAVEENTAYDFSFSYLAREFDFENTPLLQVILRRTASEHKIREIPLATDRRHWITERLRISTGDQTRALEIRLTGKSCGQQICPLFGKLWLDDFNLSNAKKGRRSLSAPQAYSDFDLLGPFLSVIRHEPNRQRSYTAVVYRPDNYRLSFSNSYRDVVGGRENAVAGGQTQHVSSGGGKTGGRVQ